MTTIKVRELIGCEGRSRVNVAKLGLQGLTGTEGVVLDFDGVEFLSRSFTDEIVSQMEGKKYTTVNANEVISNMFAAVTRGRSRKREHRDDGSTVRSFSTMADLSRFLNSLA